MRTQAAARTWYDLLTFLSLAAGLGLACGIVLGGLALLFATPARGAEPEGVLLLRPRLSEEGLLPGSLSARAVPVYTSAVFHIAESSAVARVVQSFRSPAEGWYDGLYSLPLPAEAELERLRVLVGGQVVESEMPQAIAANRFMLEVGSIGPGQTVTIEIEYQEPLRHDGNRFSSRFPMTIGPRRNAAGPL